MSEAEAGVCAGTRVLFCDDELKEGRRRAPAFKKIAAEVLAAEARDEAGGIAEHPQSTVAEEAAAADRARSPRMVPSKSRRESGERYCNMPARSGSLVRR